MSGEDGGLLYRTYDRILGKIVNMIWNPEPWQIKRPSYAPMHPSSPAP